MDLTPKHQYMCFTAVQRCRGSCIASPNRSTPTGSSKGGRHRGPRRLCRPHTHPPSQPECARSPALLRCRSRFTRLRKSRALACLCTTGLLGSTPRLWVCRPLGRAQGWGGAEVGPPRPAVRDIPCPRWWIGLRFLGPSGARPGPSNARPGSSAHILRQSHPVCVGGGAGAGAWAWARAGAGQGQKQFSQPSADLQYPSQDKAKRRYIFVRLHVASSVLCATHDPHRVVPADLRNTSTSIVVVRLIIHFYRCCLYGDHTRTRHTCCEA